MKDLLEEALEKHREVKDMLLTLMEKAQKQSYGKERLYDEMFKLYRELK